MHKILSTLLLAIFGLAKLHANLPSPYDSVDVLPFDSHHYFDDKKAFYLKRLIKQFKVHTALEIGSYLGASTRFIAKTLPEGGKVYAVDHWLGNDEWQDRAEFQKVKPLLYRKFLSNVIHAGLCHKIVPVRMPSLEAEKALDIVPDLVFIDGSHDFDNVYADISAWFPRVKGHGVLCGDDLGWGGRSKPVKRAVEKYAKEHNLKIQTNGWCWNYVE